MNHDQSRSNSRIQNTPSRTQVSTQQAQALQCRGCSCPKCKQLTVDTRDIKMMLEKLSTTKVHEVSTDTAVKTVNLCGQDLPEEMELSINYAYKDSG